VSTAAGSVTGASWSARHPANTTAFISGITRINRVLGAFANGQLKTYDQLTAMTKTGEWKSPP
jgi:hypothetical protein